MREDVWIDPEYKKVTCPACTHEWWQKLSFGSPDKSFCPKCKAPLLVRTANMNDYVKSTKETNHATTSK